jgi:hypothetical protein
MTDDTTGSAIMSDGTTGGGTGGGKRLAVYAINEKEGGGSWWQRIGTAFTNRDGSLGIYLDALPLGTNKLQVREPRDEGRAAPSGQGGTAGRRPQNGEEARP